MALSPKLQQFKASGEYRLEFDKSQTSNIDVQTLRLVVGHSKKGPYNTPVLIDNVENFKNVFGSIDKNLERKGMFFHRSAIESLSRGPILALNLTNFSSSDVGTYVAPNTNGNKEDFSTTTSTVEYTKFFDSDKFMVPTTKQLLKLSNDTDDSQLINFANVKQSPITIFVRKAQNVTQFNITAREFYAEKNEEVPDFMHESDYISDYMIDVFVFKGKFEPLKMNNDEVYGGFFNQDGLNKEQFNQFTALRQVKLEAQYTGSLIPNFKDLEGNDLYIESAINAEARRTGLFCAVNEDAVMDPTGTKLDLIGHGQTKSSGANYELLSYKMTSDDKIITYDFDGNEASYAVNGTSFEIIEDTSTNPITNFKITAGNYVPAENGRLAKVKRVVKQTTDTNEIKYSVICDIEPKSTWDGFFEKSFEEASAIYKPFVLNGANIAHKNISQCLTALNKGNGIYDALIDRDAIDFRYVVDTFASKDVNGLLNKVQLTQLAKDRKNASAIVNAPTVEEFKNSTNPSFTDQNNIFKAQFIKDGGNLNKNPEFIYALPGITQGANYGFFYTPGLVIGEGGKDIIVPPAAYVANNYIDKYTTSQPWSIVAGPRRGVVSGNNVKGVEYAFDKNDRSILEPFGLNPIVFQRGVGLTITGNKTAQQSIKTALSSAHVRESLIFIQNGIGNILKDYVFEFNNVQTRLEIKTLVDSFMEGVKQDGGVFEYRNIMNKSNNTDDVIDQNFGIVDTYIEPVKGLEVVVQRTTILNTGEISTITL